ncbi:MAG: ribulose-phosphate 3-epimerase, partial [Ignavibacteria bacterium]|nr:ribulose-phosphate 3-epimerase [Ignavibacteria bacterium]
AGAEILVAGSAVFGKPDPAKALRELLAAASVQASEPSLA